MKWGYTDSRNIWLWSNDETEIAEIVVFAEMMNHRLQKYSTWMKGWIRGNRNVIIQWNDDKDVWEILYSDEVMIEVTEIFYFDQMMK